MALSTGASSRRVHPWPLYALFFGSGVAALVYQVVWSRWLNEIFGVTVYAVTSVLITFLGGLALGGVTLGRIVDRSRRPLTFLGLLELGVAASALAGWFTISLLEPLHLAAATRLAPDSAPLLGVRVLLASIVILPPTFLMGGTLPAMTRVFTRSLSGFGRELSALYAINTTGAVAGTLLAGFVLIRAVGLTQTLWIAIAINGVIGLTALRLARHWRAPEPDLAAAHEPSPLVGVPANAPRERVGSGLLVVMGLSGFVSLGLEVLWTRALVLPLGTSTYAFVTMLAAFLVGLSLGGIIARAVVARVGSLRGLLGWLQVGIGSTTLATLPLIAYLGGGAWERTLEATGVGWLGFVAARFGISFLVMLVPTTLIGMTFPVAGALWVRDRARLGRGVGQVYGANTLGNIAGAAVTGFWLIPFLGVQRSVPLLVGIVVLCAAWGLLGGRSSGVRRTVGATAVGCGAVASAILLFFWQPSPFRMHGEEPGDRTLFYREGVVGTVKVVQKAGNARQRLMAVDGVKIGESHGGVDAKQQALAHFPFLILSDHEIRRVLTIGLGTGILAGEVLRHPRVESLVCLEIAPAVIEASRLFDDWNGRLSSNPRATIVNDDGVSYMRRTRGEYDAIISDAKSRAGHAANALFFSVDYYELCRHHLVPGGLMIQWVPLAVPGEEFRTILRTFAGAFAELYVWLGNDSCFLVGRDRPIVLDPAHVAHELEAGAAGALGRYGWGNASTFTSMLVADRASLATLLERERTVNSLDRPYLEFYSLRHVEEAPGPRRAENMRDVTAEVHDPFANVRWVAPDTALVLADAALARRFVEASALVELGGASASQGIASLRRIVAERPTHMLVREEAGRAVFDAALALQRRGDHETAIELYREAAAYRPEHALTFNNLGGALGRQGLVEEAMENVEWAIRLNPGLAGAHENLGVLFLLVGRAGEAAAEFRTALDIDPSSGVSHRHLAELLRALGDHATADYHMRAAQRLGSP